MALSPTVHHTVIPVTCISTDFTNVFAKIDDFGDFEVVNSASVVEATFNGRISADSFALGTNGAIFELRVDDSPSPVGWARATFRRVELAGGAGVQASMTGFFPDLAEGTHSVSIWVMAGNN